MFWLVLVVVLVFGLVLLVGLIGLVAVFWGSCCVIQLVIGMLQTLSVGRVGCVL